MPIILIILIVATVILFIIGIAVLAKLFLKQMRNEAAYHAKITVIKFESVYKESSAAIYTQKSRDNYARQSKISVPIPYLNWKGATLQEADC